MIVTSVWADDFTVERAVNLGQLDSWADVSKFQWQEIDHGILDNREEMDALKTLFYDQGSGQPSFPRSCDVYQEYRRPFEKRYEGVLS